MHKLLAPHLALLLILAGGPAAAQVTVNPNALDPATPPAAKPAPRPQPARPPAAAKPPIAAPPVAAPQPPPPTLPAIPQVAPAAPVIPPAIAVPTRPSPPLAPVAIAADAPGVASNITDGIRLTFGAGRAEMNQATADAVRGLARAIAAKGQPTATYTVSSLASGAADDSSAARRLSLTRGLAVRSLLITEGIASTRIFVRALGLATDTPADRVDIVVGKPAS